MTPNRFSGPGTPAPSGLRQARIARVHNIRRCAIAASLALFVAVWMLITLTLVSGHDPALARSRPASVRAATSSTTTPSTTTPAASPPTTSQSSAAGSSGSSASGASSSGLSAVTSSQS